MPQHRGQLYRESSSCRPIQPIHAMPRARMSAGAQLQRLAAQHESSEQVSHAPQQKMSSSPSSNVAGCFFWAGLVATRDLLNWLVRLLFDSMLQCRKRAGSNTSGCDFDVCFARCGDIAAARNRASRLKLGRNLIGQRTTSRSMAPCSTATGSASRNTRACPFW